jgi:hypothetical protein
VTKAGRESLDVLVEVSGHLERCYHTTMVTDDDGVPMARIVISLRTHSPLTRYFWFGQKEPLKIEIGILNFEYWINVLYDICCRYNGRPLTKDTFTSNWVVLIEEKRRIKFRKRFCVRYWINIQCSNGTIEDLSLKTYSPLKRYFWIEKKKRIKI